MILRTNRALLPAALLAAMLTAPVTADPRPVPHNTCEVADLATWVYVHNLADLKCLFARREARRSLVLGENFQIYGGRKVRSLGADSEAEKKVAAALEERQRPISPGNHLATMVNRYNSLGLDVQATLAPEVGQSEHEIVVHHAGDFRFAVRQLEAAAKAIDAKKAIVAAEAKAAIEAAALATNYAATQAQQQLDAVSATKYSMWQTLMSSVLGAYDVPLTSQELSGPCKTLEAWMKRLQEDSVARWQVPGIRFTPELRELMEKLPAVTAQMPANNVEETSTAPDETSEDTEVDAD